MLWKELKTTAPTQAAPDPQRDPNAEESRPAKPLSDLAVAVQAHERLTQQVQETDEKYLYLRTIKQSTDEEDKQRRQKLAADQQKLTIQISDLEKRPPKSPETRPTTAPAKNSDTDKAKSRLEELRQLRTQLAAVAWQLKELEQLAETRKRNASQATSQPVKRPQYGGDFQWRDLMESAMQARQRHQYERARLRDSHPTLIRLKNVADTAMKLVKDREAELDKQWKDNRSHLSEAEQIELVDPRRAEWLRKLEAARNDASRQAQQIDLLRHKERIYQKEVDNADTNFKNVFRNAETLRREVDALTQKQEAFTALRDLLFKTQMERDVPGSIEVLAKATAPSRPSSDRRLVFSAMAFFLALGAGVGLAFVRGVRSKEIHEAIDLPPVLRAPFLGQLPLVQTKNGSPVEDDPNYREGVRMVRTALLSRIGNRKGAAILVTSAGRGVGKSTVAAALARSLAQSGKTILLIDADMRNPRLGSLFGIETDTGLAASLAKRTPDSEAIVPTDTDGLHILPSVKFDSRGDLELISNGALSASLKRWCRQYDILLLDGPPLLSVADARILSSKTDGTIMVVRQENCNREEIVDALAYLGASGGSLLGTVLIGSSRRRGYGYSYYSYGYGKDDGEKQLNGS